VRPKLVSLVVGAIFGAALSWTGMTSPNVIRDALLLRSSYLFLFFGSAVATAFIGLRILRARRSRALLVDKPVRWEPVRPQRRHIVGSLVFGVGWGIADVCPGPIATQLGQGIAWSVFTAAGLIVGIWLYLRAGRAVVPARAGLTRSWPRPPWPTRLP
jgi:uncharacterized membrane protein YedE/YeeE